VAQTVKPGAPAESSSSRFGRELWREIKGLVQVRRMDAQDTALLAPQQAYFLRQNLKLRLLTARIALLAHDEGSYKADLTAAQGWLKRYFNTRDARIVAARASLDRLVNSPVSIQLPTLDESLNALQASRLGRSK
jgi:uroporphyrin-3 C-methyltransferase